jgi:hypothetical protein
LQLRAAKIVRTISHTLLATSLAFCLYLAFGAYHSSKEVGAGAAQGDLGFYMVLQVITPVVLLIVGLLWGLAWFSGRKLASVGRLSSLAAWLALATVLVTGWNWFFLFALWKA